MRLPSNFLRPSFPSISLPIARLSREQLIYALSSRAPAVSQIAVFLLAVYGPLRLPTVFAICIILVHIAFVGSNVRTAWGMRFASTAVLKCAATDWRSVCSSPSDFDRVKHLIILPNYKESIETLQETLTVLASHPNAFSSYRIVLACECSEERVVEDKVNLLLLQFEESFFEISFTLHPKGILGEAAGKSSNVAWASREMHRRNPTYLKQQIITVMDADSCFASDFFAAAASKFIDAPPHIRRSLMFVAPIFFDRNASHVAAPVVIADILWCAAGLGTMYEGSRAKLPTSAYAVTEEMAERIGWWDAGPEAIGEDLHMSVKAFFETQGELHVEAIYSPASQCNVVGHRFPRTMISSSPPSTLDEESSLGGPSGEEREAWLKPWQYVYEFCSDVLARYAQAKRHMWGSLDSGYAIRRLALQQFGPGSDLLAHPSSSHSRSRNARGSAYSALGQGQDEDHALEDGLRTVSMRLDLIDSKKASPSSASTIATTGIPTTMTPPPRSSLVASLPPLSASRSTTASNMSTATAPSISEMSESDYTSFASTEDGLSDDEEDQAARRRRRERGAEMEEEGSPPSSNSASPVLRAVDLKSSTGMQQQQQQSFDRPATSFDHGNSTFSAAASSKPFPLFNLVVLLTRLYEAHFNLGYLFMFLSVGPYFNPGLEPTALWKLRATGEAIKVSQSSIPAMSLWGTEVAAALGTFAFFSTACIFWYYEKFHHATTTTRWENRPHLGARAYQQTVRTMPGALWSYIALPFVPLFGIIPLYHAQICHLYSNRLTYQVSAKPIAPINGARSNPSTRFGTPSISKEGSSVDLVGMGMNKGAMGMGSSLRA